MIMLERESGERSASNPGVLDFDVVLVEQGTHSEPLKL